MNWEVILEVTVPIFAVMAFVWNKLDKKIDDVQKDLKDVQKDIKDMSQLLSRLEGRFEERGYWESRKNGTENKS